MHGAFMYCHVVSGRSGMQKSGTSEMWSSMLLLQTETLETISQRWQGDKKVRALNPELSPTVEPPAN